MERYRTLLVTRFLGFTIRRETKQCVSVCFGLLLQLHRLGVYHRTLIIVTGRTSSLQVVPPLVSRDRGTVVGAPKQRRTARTWALYPQPALPHDPNLRRQASPP
jgi:hypothetical protein